MLHACSQYVSQQRYRYINSVCLKCLIKLYLIPDSDDEKNQNQISVPHFSSRDCRLISSMVGKFSTVHSILEIQNLIYSN